MLNVLDVSITTRKKKEKKGVVVSICSSERNKKMTGWCVISESVATVRDVATSVPKLIHHSYWPLVAASSVVIMGCSSRSACICSPCASFYSRLCMTTLHILQKKSFVCKVVECVYSRSGLMWDR